MDVILATIKQELGQVIRVGYQLTGFYFVLACLFNYIVTLQGKADWTRLLTNLVIVFVLLSQYVWIMDISKGLVDGVQKEVNSNATYLNQYQTMVDNFRTLYENSQVTDESGGGILKGISFERIGQKMLHNLIVNVSFIFFGLVSYIMSSLRADLIGILWMLGPLIIPFLIFQSTAKIVVGWYTGLISIYLWPLVWTLTLGIAVAQSGNITLDGQGLIEFISLNFATCAMLIFAPMLISSLAAGVGAGFVGSIAAAAAFGNVKGVASNMLKTTRKK